ncbi:hypothetical protein D3C77_705330 [compost metagenome]
MLVQVIAIGVYEAQMEAVLAGFHQVEAEGPIHRKEILAVVQWRTGQGRLSARQIKYSGTGGHGEQKKQTQQEAGHGHLAGQ